WCGFNVAGPDSRALLARLTQTDMSNENWGFMRSKSFVIAGMSAIGLRVSFSGDLGWEVCVKQSDQKKLYDALFESGADLGVCAVGGRALGSLRIEKGYGSWGREYSPEYWPQEVGLAGLIKMDKPAFLGREAYGAIADNAPREKLVLLEVSVTSNADASGGEPVFLPDNGSGGGRAVGRVSSGAYGYFVQKSLAFCFIETGCVKAGAEFEIAILGQPHKARLLECPPFDPSGARLRG
ncbi:MAG: aminomethyltransferase family protein, partial [Proteobacteria bacterium]|nr:aminomethyltransferase family protein [Pseudomonadota bacterium]